MKQPSSEEWYIAVSVPVYPNDIFGYRYRQKPIIIGHIGFVYNITGIFLPIPEDIDIDKNKCPIIIGHICFVYIGFPSIKCPNLTSPHLTSPKLT
jgi:hypothetical protein